MAAFASLSWHICWTGWFMTASAGTAGACVCAASYPPASLKLATWWQGFREQQERASLDAQTSFKPLLLSPSLSSPWPKQVTWRAWSQWGDIQSYSTKDHGYKERENVWPLFVVCCRANQTVLCTLYKENGLEPTGTQSFSGIQLKKKKNQSYVGRPGGFLRLEISNWQLIRNRFYLSSSTFRNFSLFFEPTFKILRFCIKEMSFGNLWKERQSGKNC